MDTRRWRSLGANLEDHFPSRDELKSPGLLILPFDHVIDATGEKKCL